MAQGKKVVVFLQNAWSPMFASGTWPRDSWLAALERSPTGRKLRHLREAAGPRLHFWWDNTTPIVGDTPDSIIPPDLEHIRRVIRVHDPKYVVACGKQAAEILVPLVSRLLILPHPTYRVVTNELFKQAGRLLAEGFYGILELEQGRNKKINFYRWEETVCHKRNLITGATAMPTRS